MKLQGIHFSTSSANTIKNLTMAKIRELFYNERLVIIHLREAGLSYAEIAQQVDCTKSASFKIYKTFENTGSIEKREDLVDQRRVQIEQNVPFVKLL